MQKMHILSSLTFLLSIFRMASVDASHSAELKAVQQRIEAAESSLTLKEAELNRAREKVSTYLELTMGDSGYKVHASITPSGKNMPINKIYRIVQFFGG